MEEVCGESAKHQLLAAGTMVLCGPHASVLVAIEALPTRPSLLLAW